MSVANPEPAKGKVRPLSKDEAAQLDAAAVAVKEAKRHRDDVIHQHDLLAQRNAELVDELVAFRAAGVPSRDVELSGEVAAERDRANEAERHLELLKLAHSDVVDELDAARAHVQAAVDEATAARTDAATAAARFAAVVAVVHELAPPVASRRGEGAQQSLARLLDAVDAA